MVALAILVRSSSVAAIERIGSGGNGGDLLQL